MDTGLSSSTHEKICLTFKKFPQIEKGILYGSRAMGTHKPGSDIDICLLGKNLHQDLIWKISEALEDLMLSYTVDLSLFEAIDNLKLKEHISRVGIDFCNLGSYASQAEL